MMVAIRIGRGCRVAVQFRDAIAGGALEIAARVRLAGCDLLTISPDLLEQMEKTEGWVPHRLSVDAAKASDAEKIHLDEKTFRWMHNQVFLAMVTSPQTSAGKRQGNMDSLLRDLLNKLEQIGTTNQEIYDTECRDMMSQAIWSGFIDPSPAFVLADDFGLYSPAANARVRRALETYIREANETAALLGVKSIPARIAAFQKEDVCSDVERIYYDDVFGYWRPETG